VKPILNPIAAFDESVPEEFQRDTLRCLLDNWSIGFDDCAKFPKPERHDLIGHYRRALFESQWRVLAEQYPDDLTAEAVLNRRGTYYHTQITCGSVRITASFVASPDAIVRRADFRRTLAEDNQRLMSWMPRRKIPKNAFLYAVLLYGPGDARRPGFVDFVFPRHDWTGYLGRISLFDKFPDLVKSMVDFDVELVEDAAGPELRTDLPKVSDN
jgi:hypothetical protein